MSLSMKTKSVLSGPRLVEAFLEELALVVRRSPDHEIEGTPQEIVEDVVVRTDRFGGCAEECIQNLAKQLAMAVKAKGRPHHLEYKMLSQGRIKVVFA